jgi:hypothetical protein
MTGKGTDDGLPPGPRATGILGVNTALISW